MLKMRQSGIELEDFGVVTSVAKDTSATTNWKHALVHINQTKLYSSKNHDLKQRCQI